MSEKNELPLRQMDRRGFLGFLAALLGEAVILATPGSSLLPRNPEKNSQSKEIAVLDFFDMSEALFAQFANDFPPDFSIESAWESMGVSDHQTEQGLRQALIPNGDTDVARAFFLGVLLWHYKDHGVQVGSVIQKTRADLFSHSQDPRAICEKSIVTTVELGDITFDELGNPRVEITINWEKVAEIVGSLDADVVNMSFEPGTMMIEYQQHIEVPLNPEMGSQFPYERNGKYFDYKGAQISEEEYQEIMNLINARTTDTPPTRRGVRYIDAYHPDRADNIFDLVNIAHRFPNKIFVAAGGNVTYFNGIQFPDISEPRKLLEQRGLWPKNLLVVGYEYNESGFVGPSSRGGVDVFVPYEVFQQLDVQPASSFATPVVSEIVAKLLEQVGDQWRSEFFEQFVVTKDVGGGVYPIIDLDLVKEELMKSDN